MDEKELKDNRKNVILDNEELLEIYGQFLEVFERLDNFIHKRLVEVKPEKVKGSMVSSLYDDFIEGKKRKE